MNIGSLFRKLLSTDRAPDPAPTVAQPLASTTAALLDSARSVLQQPACVHTRNAAEWLTRTRLLNALLSAEPDNMYCYSALFHCYRNLLIGAADAPPTTDQDYVHLIGRGNAHFLAREYRAAEALFEAAIRACPDRPFAYSRLGQMQIARGAFREAAGAFANAHTHGRWLDRMIRFDDAFLDQIGALSEIEPPGPSMLWSPAAAQGALVVFVSCDMTYLKRFVYALANSIVRNAGTAFTLHLHVINPDDSLIGVTDRIKSALTSNPLVVSTEHTALGGLNDEGRRAYFASSRFLHLPSLTRHYRCPILTLDADMLVLRPFDPIIRLCAAADAGFVSLDPHKYGLWEVLCGGLIWTSPTPGAFEFCKRVRACVLHQLGAGGLVWYVDQLALLCAYANLSIETGKARFTHIPEKLFDFQTVSGHLDRRPLAEAIFWSVTASIPENLQKTELALFRSYND